MILSKAFALSLLSHRAVLSGAAVQPLPASPLPASFKWGVASSAYQSEGGLTNSNWDIYNANPLNNQDLYGTSVDFRHRYRSDIALAQALGITQYRFGINWARVQPSMGVWNDTELAYYDDVILAITEAGMTPQPTLDHWVYPKWIYDMGGWNNNSTVTYWLTYAETMVTRMKGRNAAWLTFNEAFFYIISETKNYVFDGSVLVPVLMAANLISCHRAAYDMIHQIDPGSTVSSNFIWTADDSVASPASDLLFLGFVTDKLDFIALDYYYESVGDDGLVNVLAGSPWNNTQYPQDIYVALHQLSQRFPSKPIFITENGMATENGSPRSDGWTRSLSLSDSVYWVQRAYMDGINVIGYQYWSLTDNFEFGSYSPRFGLYTVDVLTDPTLTRKPTDAVATYKTIISGRGVSSSYVPHLIRCSLSAPDLTCPTLL